MKIIIWGYPLHSHTHSYIHSAFYKSFKYLGYETYWFHDEDYPKDFDYNDCVFITEGYADKNIPLLKSSTYLVHVCHNPKKYLGNVKRLVDIRYYLDFIDDVNYRYKLDKSKCEELDLGVLYEKNSLDYEVLYMAWGTNLLPEEINLEWAEEKKSNTYYFIGSLNENVNDIRIFAKKCFENGVDFVHIDPWRNPVSEEDNIILTRKSFMSPDFRHSKHKKWGYIACRLMKSISYGHLGMTNSLSNKKFIDDTVVYSENPEELFYLGMEKMKNIDLIKHQMNIIKTKHTWINRVNGLERIL